VPGSPKLGEIADIEGGGITVKRTPPLDCPFAVTTTLPVVVPAGTTVVICVALQVEGDATVPLKETVLAPCVAPKFEPEIVTCVPTGPDAGDSVAMEGAVITVNGSPLLDKPATLTTTFPLVAAAGTVTVTAVCVQLVVAAPTPLNITRLAFEVPPRFVPVIVTPVPGEPLVGDKLEIAGPATTVNAT
jgi:hypothetical protein